MRQRLGMNGIGTQLINLTRSISNETDVAGISQFPRGKFS